ncbi:MAG: transketolase family protein, partial [Duodenibacillus sp.]
YYDDNGISIDGDIKGWFADDTRKRFEAYGWNVIGPIDGHDAEAVGRATEEAKASSDKPTLIICRTVIGQGSPNRAGTSKAHGEALGDEEIALTRANIGWNFPPFEVPAEVYEAMDARPAGKAMEEEWNALFAAYEAKYPELAAEFKRRLAGDLPADFEEHVMNALCEAQAKAETVATRKASQKALDALAPHLPELLGGSADLTGSNLTNWKGVERLTHDNMCGRHISYGVREFGMSAIQNGIALYGGFIPFSGTFLTFSDYARNAVRMAALMKQRSIFVYTHDSIGLGEDGPTHQSIEHVASLRLIPGLDVWRPADTVEAVVSWAEAIERRNGPSCIVCSRQNVTFLDRDEVDADAIARGGYVAAEAPAGEGKAEVILVATGSETELAMKTRAILAAQNVQARVVSMPSCDVFDRQDAQWKASVLPAGVPMLAIEAGVTGLWYKYMQGRKGDVVGIDTFGESAPASVLWKHFGFTVEACVQKVQALLAE